MRHIPEDELHAYLDQGLSRTQCVEIESHLADCPSCQATRDGIAALRDRTTALLARLAPPRHHVAPAFEGLAPARGGSGVPAPPAPEHRGVGRQPGRGGRAGLERQLAPALGRVRPAGHAGGRGPGPPPRRPARCPPAARDGDRPASAAAPTPAAPPELRRAPPGRIRARWSGPAVRPAPSRRSPQRRGTTTRPRPPGPGGAVRARSEAGARADPAGAAGPARPRAQRDVADDVVGRRQGRSR